MKHFASKIIGLAASSAFLFWATVAPSGADLCNSGKEFLYHPLNESGHEAGINAKAQFCRAVTNNPA